MPIPHFTNPDLPTLNSIVPMVRSLASRGMISLPLAEDYIRYISIFFDPYEYINLNDDILLDLIRDWEWEIGR